MSALNSRSNSFDGHQSKKRKHNDPVEDFTEWCQKEGLRVSDKVKVSRQGSCAQYGMVACSDIEEGEELFEIPRRLLLTPSTSHIASLLNDNASSLESKSGWAPLLLSLLYEFTSEDSHWRAYLTLVPDFSQLDLPMFWPRSELEDELSGTGVMTAVDQDLTNLTEEYNTVILPFMTSHPEVFKPECRDIELFKKMVAFVMAYSFTEPLKADTDDSDDEDEATETKSPPMMVPMADILNHVADNNAQLKFGEQSLKMVAIKNIKEGEEVYNTYGELSNHDLLHMYGFTLPHLHNRFDVVEIPLELLKEAFIHIGGNIPMEQRWKLLDETVGVMEDLGSHVILEDQGVLNDHVLLSIFKLMFLDDASFDDEFKQLKEDGWMEEGSGDELSMNFESIANMEKKWRDVLARMAESHLANYPQGQEVEMKILRETTSSRQKFASCLRLGHLHLLYQLINACIINS